MLSSGIYNGEIRHRRYVPKRHEFTYKMYWSLLDLDNLETDFKKHKLWSLEKWNLISFKAKDFHSRSGLNTKDSIIKTIKDRTGEDFSGKIFLFSHLRFLGLNFNSVCFYFCIDDEGFKYIVAEITNTPWGERHPYVLKCDEVSDSKFHFEFKKEFHVSPFIKMDMLYRWSFIFDDESLRVHMVVNKINSDVKIFDATFTGDYLALTNQNMTSMMLKKPFQPVKMILAIYWQALKLWLKKVRFVEHPKHQLKKDLNPNKGKNYERNPSSGSKL